MSCQRIPNKNRGLRAAHRLFCRECRAAKHTDMRVDWAVKQGRNVSPPAGGLERVLAATQSVEENYEGAMPFSVELARRRNGFFSPKRVRRFKMAAGAAFLGLVGWGYALNITPQVSIPKRPIPSPNGYDYLLQLKDVTTKIQKERVDLAMGARKIDPKTDKPLTLLEREAILKESAPTLNLLRLALKQPDMLAPERRRYTDLFSELAEVRSGARLLVLESQIREAHGDMGGAMESCFDAIELGLRLPAGQGLIGKLVGIACQAIGRAHAEKILPKLSAQEAAAAAKRLHAIQAYRYPLAETLREEMYGGQSTLLTLFNRPFWQRGMIEMFGMTGGDGETAQNPFMGVKIVPLLWLSKRTVMQNYTGYMQSMIANVEKPYAKRNPSPPIPNDPICQIMLPAFGQARFSSELSEGVMNPMLEIRLALQAYQKAKGFYPSKLSELVSAGYLASVPIDAFYYNQYPFQYQKKGNSYLLYSVGPDGVDHGGVPMENPNAQNNAPHTPQSDFYRPTPDAKGDIVAGINGK